MAKAMRRVGHLQSQVVSFENIYSAFKKARKGTKSDAMYRFSFSCERELFELQASLRDETYCPGAYHTFMISEPKVREIAVAPFKDRVVHHALVNVLEPLYEKRFIFDSYATRKGKGTHKAVLKAQYFLKQMPYYLKMDIEKYFASIDHAILMDVLKRTLKDPFINRLCERIIACGGNDAKGLPIGNLTSQFFSNVYLNPFDHFVKENMGVKGYVRYMDDFVLFSDNIESLKHYRDTIEMYLQDKLALKVKHHATAINTRLHGLPFLGVHIFPSIIRLKRENFKRSFMKMKAIEQAYVKGELSSELYDQRMHSLIGHLSYWNNHLLKAQLMIREYKA